MTSNLLSQSRHLLLQTGGSRGIWTRASVLLARQALEEILDRLWSGTFADMKETKRITQFRCLKYLTADPRIPLNPVVVENAHFAWSTLSRACHHQEYELAPSISEIGLLIDHVEQFVVSVNITIVD